MEKGLWVAFEGNDGSGKTTQVQRAAVALREHGLEVVETREPDKYRQQIFAKELKADGKTQLLLFAADRRRHLLETVLPALLRKSIVLSDRSEGSTFAYQCYQFGIPYGQVHGINQFATDGYRPDLTILLQVDFEVAQERLKNLRGERPNHFDRVAENDWTLRNFGYHQMACHFPNWHLVDANKTEDKVFQDIWDIFKTKGVINA